MARESDPKARYELERFVAAQDNGGTYDAAVAEIRAGRKVSHWMWFVFPQVAGLGRSPVSRRYAISSLDEAKAYLRHPVLGRRLIECAQILTQLGAPTAQDIFGSVDAQKLQSSMTLFALAAPDEPAFQDVLAKYFGGKMDSGTEPLLRASHH
ncbi:MAG TPA: DUF1810 domain-containing protein [Solirubrobacteraceae bacterium]